MSKHGKIGDLLELIFWIAVVVSITVFDMVFSPSFWLLIACMSIIQSCISLLSNK